MQVIRRGGYLDQLCIRAFQKLFLMFFVLGVSMLVFSADVFASPLKIEMNTYSIHTGLSANNQLQIRVYVDHKTGVRFLYEYYHPNGQLKYRSTADPKTRQSVMFESYDDQGKLIKRKLYRHEGEQFLYQGINHDVLNNKPLTFDLNTGEVNEKSNEIHSDTRRSGSEDADDSTVSEEFYPHGTIKSRVTYDSNGKRVLLQEYSVSGNLSRVIKYSPNSQLVMMRETYTTNGLLRSQTTYHYKTGKRLQYIVFNTAGNKILIDVFDGFSGIHLSRTKYYPGGNLNNVRHRILYEAHTGRKRSSTLYYNRGGINHKSTYDLETGKRVLFEKYTKQENLLLRTTFDAVSGLKVLSEQFGWVGQVTRKTSYEYDTNRKITQRFDQGLVSSRVTYQLNSGNKISDVRYHTGTNKLKYIYSFDQKTGFLSSYEAFNIKGLLIARIIYNPTFKGKILSYETFNDDGNLRMKHAYHSRTRKRVLVEFYDGVGQVTEQTVYHPITGKILTYKTFYPDGQLQKHYAYDVVTNQRTLYEIYDPSGNLTEKHLYDKESGHMLKRIWMSYNNNVLLTKREWTLSPGVIESETIYIIENGEIIGSNTTPWNIPTFIPEHPQEENNSSENTQVLDASKQSLELLNQKHQKLSEQKINTNSTSIQSSNKGVFVNTTQKTP